MAGSSTADSVVFYYDLASPDAYLAGERAHHVLGVVPEWQPVALGGPVFRCAEEEDIFKSQLEYRAARQGVQPIRWPDPFPSDTAFAMLVATYAKEIGKVVAFSLAAFRQAFAAGRDLSQEESVLIAAAACEMHPAAVLKVRDLRGPAQRLAAATEEARAAGVVETPAFRVGDRVVDWPEQLR